MFLKIKFLVHNYIIFLFLSAFVTLSVLDLQAENNIFPPDTLSNITYHDLFTLSDSELNDITLRLNKELMINSDNLELNLLRAKLYLYQKNFKASESLLKRLNQVDPNNGEVNYFLSRLYTQIDSLTISYSYMYRIDTEGNFDPYFISELENDALPFYTINEKEAYKSSENKVEYILMTWMRKDPYPASIDNEYFDQMIKRLEYAYDNYFDGFALDDRGKIYIKYGKPDILREFVHTGYRTECWIYRKLTSKEITFDFIRSFQRPAWTQVRFSSDIPGDSFISNKYSGEFDDTEPSRTFFEDRAMLTSRYQEIYAELQSLAIDAEINEGQRSVESESEVYLMNTYFNSDKESKAYLPDVVTTTPVPTVSLSVDYCRFKGDSNSVNLETYLGMPINEVKNAIDDYLPKRIYFNEKVSIKDRSLFPVASHSDRIEFSYDNIETAHFIDMLTFTVPEDKFVIAFEVDDDGKRFIASRVLEVDNSNFIQEDLFLSDLQLSIGIRNNVSPGKFTKNNLFVQPYPYIMFSRSAPLYLYFEIYNLTKDHGFTNYDISYGLAKSYEKSILEKIFTFDFSDVPGSIQFNQNYNGNSLDDFIYFQLNVNNLDVGEYILKVKVTDKNSGKTFTRDKRFFLTQ